MRTANDKRRQRVKAVTDRAMARIAQMRFEDADAYYYETLRESFLDAGATETDIRRLAYCLVQNVVECVPADDTDLREEQFGFIARDFARQDMKIGVGTNDAFIAVEFLNAPHIH